MELPIERHPLSPFLPEGTRLLMLGSFPPPRERWSMEFFYPNFQNDMWRILALLFLGDREGFVASDHRRFDEAHIRAFCTTQGIGWFDTACAVRRLKQNASDQFLEIVEPTDMRRLLAAIPQCQAVVTTGQKASETLCRLLEAPMPTIGQAVTLCFAGRPLRFYRMPSSSRAYPLSLPKKAAYYATMFRAEGFEITSRE